VTRLQLHLADLAHRRQVVLGEVAGHGLVHLGRLHKLHQANLRCVVAVPLHRLELRNHARSDLQHGDGVDRPCVVEYLRHTDLLAENSCDCHLFLSSSCRR